MEVKYTKCDACNKSIKSNPYLGSGKVISIKLKLDKFSIGEDPNDFCSLVCAISFLKNKQQGESK